LAIHETLAVFRQRWFFDSPYIGSFVVGGTLNPLRDMQQIFLAVERIVVQTRR